MPPAAALGRLVPLAAAALLCGGCATTGGEFGGAVDLVRLRIDNPAGHRMRLSTVAEPAAAAGATRDVDLGAPSSWTGDLRAGRYRLDVTDARGRSVALPVPGVASVAPADGLTVAVPDRLLEDEPGWTWIPPGISLRGDALGVGQEDERPAHLVRLPGFFMAVDETTNAEYAAFLNDVGAVDEGWLDLGSLKCRIKRDATGRFATDAPALPIVTVSFAGAEAYAAWRTRRDPAARVHRLPTEAEWEKAARGPDSATFDYGDVYRRAAANQESGTLRETGAFGPRGFGCRDLTGNAFEWVADVYDPAAYAGLRGRVVEAPCARSGSADAAGPYRTLRGGSFVLDGMYLRNSFRMRQRASTRTDDFGFRLVREIPAERNTP
jgi:formylglycine-generating enzyme required for sulfatase activity